uniref:Membrane protein UL56 n=1 Tax=Schistosoma mansoni TaxID=6183 RepID=A0A5K4F8B0_SCHMA
MKLVSMQSSGWLFVCLFSSILISVPSEYSRIRILMSDFFKFPLHCYFRHYVCLIEAQSSMFTSRCFIQGTSCPLIYDYKDSKSRNLIEYIDHIQMSNDSPSKYHLKDERSICSILKKCSIFICLSPFYNHSRLSNQNWIILKKRRNHSSSLMFHRYITKVYRFNAIQSNKKYYRLSITICPMRYEELQNQKQQSVVNSSLNDVTEGLYLRKDSNRILWFVSTLIIAIFITTSLMVMVCNRIVESW